MSALDQTDPQDLTIGDWHLKFREPLEEASQLVIIMNHGWTGDERSMWVFANQLPKSALLIAPRAPYLSSHSEYGGYSWVEDRSEGWSTYGDFSRAKAIFSELLLELPSHLEGDFSKISLIGFSQGAAFNYAFALENSASVINLAALAGFMPEGSEKIAAGSPLLGRSVFIAHGSKDETVPIERARQSKEIMQVAGANVEYCESEIGHKLGANCFSQLRRFFAD